MTGDLVRRVLAGERRALSRALTLVENGTPEGRAALAALYGHTGKAHIVGITGGSGVGKSTLTSALAREFRARGRTLGIVAVDPSSPFTHGALLGDRIRMQEHTRDPDVFLRSMASRGQLGGLAAMTAEVVAVLDAAGKEIIIVETVGAGQDEVEVASAADTTLLVLTPGGGDEVQAMKAGVMEVADLFVVNKADLPGAEALVAQLRTMTHMAARGGRETPIIETVATRGEGIAALAGAVEEHRRGLEKTGDLGRQRLERARRQVLAVARHELLAGLLRDAEHNGRLNDLVRAVADRKLDPYSAAQRLVE